MTSLEAEWELEEEITREFGLPTRAASPPPAQLREELRKHRDAHLRLNKAVQAMGKHIVKRGASYHFTLPAGSTAEAAQKLGIDHSTFRHLHSAMKAGNARPKTPARETGGRFLEFESEGAACPGISAVKRHWWGNRIWLDECQTSTAIDLMFGGAVLGASVCGVLKNPYECVITGAVGGGAWAVKAIDDSGGKRGIIISQPWVGPPIIWHQ